MVKKVKEVKKDRVLIIIRNGNIEVIDCTIDIDVAVVDWDNGVYADDCVYDYELDKITTHQAIEDYINTAIDVLDDRAQEKDN